VVDALFGTGLSRALTGGARRAVAAIGRAGKPVVAADVPSGLSSDSATIPGPSVRAALTVAFAAPKTCHAITPARAFCGRVVVRDIGIDVRLAKGRAARLAMTEPSDVRRLLPPRPTDSNKGDFGRLAVVAGSTGKSGAAVLAARGAIRGGAGLVTVFCPFSVQPFAAAFLPEAMSHALPEREGALASEAADELVRALNAGRFDAAVAGPGLSAAPGVVETVRSLLASRLPLVLDADALNAFPKNASAFRRRAPTVLTPHPGEAGRLLGSSAAAVQKDRLGAARALAKASRAVVVLKGDGTLVADPSGRVVVNSTGSPLLATGGTGDVLAGLLGALLAQGLGALEAAYAGAWLHGRAAELLAGTLGDAGLLARELADAIPRVRAGLSRALETDAANPARL
jgi:NAD(P)H-hydrate epimerase